jgi:hypothetical protein
LASFKHRVLQKQNDGEYIMKWLEVIKLRSAGKGSGSLEEFLGSINRLSQNGLVGIETYRHASLEMDWSVHLFWDSERPEQNGSALGLRFARALKEFGLVDHSIWIEKEK